jgi:hypothetical protein
LEFHPIANVFPLMEGPEFAELVEDIKKHGQQQPILTYEGKILDGRNRYRACLEAGEEPWVEAWSGGSPVEAVLSLNLHRRHLSSGQRSLIAERMLPHLKAEAKRRQAHGQTAPGKRLGNSLPKRDEPVDDRKAVTEAAKLTGTNRQYVQDAKKLRQEAPEVAERVERGETTIPQAKRELGWTKPPEKPLKGEDRTPVREALSDGIELPPWNPPPEQKAFRNIIKHLVALSKMDPEALAFYCEDDYDAGRRIEHAQAIRDWFERYEKTLEKKRQELRPGGLRAVK